MSPLAFISIATSTWTSFSPLESRVVSAVLEELEEALHELELTCEHSQTLLERIAVIARQAVRRRVG